MPYTLLLFNVKILNVIVAYIIYLKQRYIGVECSHAFRISVDIFAFFLV